MRVRRPLVALLAAVFLSPVPAFTAEVHASDGHVFLAQQTTEQDTGSETNTEDGGTDSEEGSGSSEAETGADEGQVEGGETETGPPWTYQMARISLALLVLIALATAGLYWRLVVQRQRRGV